MANDIERWAIDKRIPVAFIATIVIGGAFHTTILVWFASNVWFRVAALESQRLQDAPRLESVIRLEAKVDSLHASISELKAAVTALASRPQEALPLRR